MCSTQKYLASFKNDKCPSKTMNLEIKYVETVIEKLSNRKEIILNNIL